MDILFADKKLATLCHEERVQLREFGKPGAKKLRSRLADLAAAANMAAVVAGRPHPLKGNRAGQLALDLHGAVRLVLAPANDPIPTTTDGAIDWKRVTAVRILEIGNYHD